MDWPAYADNADRCHECGGLPVLLTIGGLHVQCSGHYCRERGPVKASAIEAVTAWNQQQRERKQ